MRHLLKSVGLMKAASRPAKPVTRSAAAKRQYDGVTESFTELLPWVEYDPQEKIFLLSDGKSVGQVFELTPVGCEGRPADYLQEVHEAMVAVQSTLAEREPDPWILQIYVQDEIDLKHQADHLEAYITDEKIRRSEFTRYWLKLMRRHLSATAREGGVFLDKIVTNSMWGAKARRTRLVLYRWLSKTDISQSQAVEELKYQSGRVTSTLAAGGVRAQIADGEHFYYWMLQWFNPAPAVCGGDLKKLPLAAPYPGDDNLPAGHDFAEMLTLSTPVSHPKKNYWEIDGVLSTVISVQALRRWPEIGLISAERNHGDQVYAVFDKLPPNTAMVLTMAAKPQDILREHVAKVKKASVGEGAEAVLARENATGVELAMAGGDRLVPTYIGFYVRGKDEKQLQVRINDVESLLLQNGLHAVDRASELLGCDAWIRNLPMNFDPALDKRARRTRLTFGSHAMALMPVYGRSRGTGNPGFMFWNRGGEPLTVDPLSRFDRKKNGHMLIIGPTGAGKSATLVYLILQVLAVWRPRLYIIEAGNSFGLMCDFLQSKGFSLNRVEMQPQADVSLAPFADAMSLLKSPAAATALVKAEGDLAEDEAGADGNEEDLDMANRDILGEMEIAARVMITGGEAKEDARMFRADRMIIRRAIYAAAENVKKEGRQQVIVSDVSAALAAESDNPDLDERRRGRARDMADAMSLFCDGIGGHFFNRPGSPWPNVDITHLEMGILAREGYEDALTLAYIALMNKINAVVEAHQHDQRPTIVVTDEGHIITTNPLLAPYVIKITKMWRKFGAWYWIATQNLDDFPDASRRMLSMLEWWLCLVMPKEEVDAIARFRALNEEQKSMLLSTRKEGGKYTEGVVFTDVLAALFRNVPPSVALALAATEKHEKADRAAIMEKTGCTETEAALEIAKQIDKARSLA